MSVSPGKLKHLKALANSHGVIAAAAMDQRGSLQKSIAAAKGVSPDAVTQHEMEEFKIIVSKVLTPHASAILLDPEFGLPAAAARDKNCGLLLAYEKTGYDANTAGRLPDLLVDVSVKRIVDMGGDAVKILLYYSPFDDPKINEIKHAFCERIGAECEFHQIPFFLEFIGYDHLGGSEKGVEYAKAKPEIVLQSMVEFSKPQYYVDMLKVEVPVNAEFVEGSSVYKGVSAYTRAQALEYYRKAADVASKPFNAREVSRAVSYLTRTAPLRYATATGVAQQALTLATLGLDWRHVDTLAAQLATVTAEEATAAFVEIWPEDPAVLVVGDPSLAAGLGVDAEPTPSL